MPMLMNEQIKASEVQLTGVQGEDLGVVSRTEAIALAKQLKVDLVCDSLMSSPPPCRLIARGAAKQQKQQEKREAKVQEGTLKSKEIRMTPHIEDHDYDTKLRQALSLLASGHAVQFVVRLQGKEGPKAKALLERMVSDLAGAGVKESGIQVSGKQAAVRVLPK
ncbi:translation initiation factor IF-3 [Paenibacillus cremeus]|uniref:Translation initiation factor IF-3 n=1 Tax=Paenibacillus cremeus TaxID=2163881 RepID=A0A559KDS0_9BACL|nr:translation initiation factor IF-3 [Paenibacillus cremeus]TVY10270.1 translation initiation factor IF-3 [Paenibacillus cremeus]